MFNFFKRRRKKGNGIIALDLGTDAVKAMLFTMETRQNQNGEVIGRRAIIRGWDEVRQGEGQGGVVTDIASVISDCKKAIHLASRKAGLEPAQLIMGVAGESIKGITFTETCEREDGQTKINLAELSNIIHKLEWKAFAESRKEISEEMGYPEIDIKLMDSAILETKIDGYKVANPLGFQGKQVTMSIFNSFSPLGHQGALKNIGDHLELELIGMIPTSYALSRFIGQKQENPSVIFVDVGGSATDITVVKDGALRGGKTFGVGGRTFTKRMAVELNISLKEAEKLKHAYAEDRLEQKSRKIISDILQGDVEVWLEGIVLALSEFRQIDELPGKIVLTGGGSSLPEIKEALIGRKWHKKLHFRDKPQIVFMQPNDLGAVIDETKSIRSPASIPSLALVNMGLELTAEETLMQKTLRKVIGIMKV